MENFTSVGSRIGATVGEFVNPKYGKIVGRIVGGAIGGYIDYVRGNPEAIAEGIKFSADCIRDYGFDPNDFL